MGLLEWIKRDFGKAFPQIREEIEGRGSFKVTDKLTFVTPIKHSGWHHTEIISELGSEKKHFTYEPTKHHHIVELPTPTLHSKTLGIPQPLADILTQQKKESPKNAVNFELYTPTLDSKTLEAAQSLAHTMKITEELKKANETSWTSVPNWAIPLTTHDSLTPDIKESPDYKFATKGISPSSGEWARGYERVVEQARVLPRIGKTQQDIIREWYY